MANYNRSQQSQTSPDNRASRTSRNSRRAMQRRAKRRKQGQIIRRLIFILLIIAAIVMAPTIFFRVSNVTVTGDTRYTDEELIHTSGVKQGDNMLFLDTGHIISLLESKYPYLDTVRLYRHMPSTLQIEVTDRVPMLSIENNGKYLLMDNAGKALEETDSAAKNTTEVIGASLGGLKPGDWAEDDSDQKKDQKHEKILAALRLMNLMTQYEMNDSIRSVDITKAYDVRVQYKNQYTILLGSMDKEKLEHKIQFLQAILKEPSLPKSGMIDLTGDSEARYRPQEDSTSNKTIVFEEKTIGPKESDTQADADKPADTTDKPADTADTPDTAAGTPSDTEDAPESTDTEQTAPETGQADTSTQ